MEAAAAAAAWQPSDDEAEACSQPMRTDDALPVALALCGWSYFCHMRFVRYTSQTSDSRRHASARCTTYYAELELKRI